jgi:hypothetical protein
MVLEINRARPMPPVKVRRQAEPFVEIIAGIVENRNVPAHVHMAVGIGPWAGHNDAKAWWMQFEYLLDRQRWWLQTLAIS